ncbi:uncharacterized protein RJT21DRAFT_119336 [Scheffersomyces amazonensis]|uniref:uncharacterized protein n=1 Tax=Scheffersomyces amazonensis TaxID=1078765 RepID=UPI00315DC4FD
MSSGSSRLLIRTLDSLFSSWDDEENKDEVISELLTIIAQFLDKHNTLQIIRQSTSINDELFRIYNTYIQPSSNLPKEIMFLKLLYQLSPVLNKREVLLWLNTYCKPAIDSAGYDLQFVERSRDFIKRVTIELFSTEDPDLRKGREEIAYEVMKIIMKIYIGNDDSVYEIIRLRPTNIEKDTQAYEERLRFIKQNCHSMLQDYGLKCTEDCLKLINEFFIIPNQRLSVLTILSSLVSSNTSQILHITNMDLFPNILRSLSYDFSESILLSSLSTLIMLIPQICNKVASYLSDILLIYVRISNWEEFNKYIHNRFEVLQKYIDDKNIPWKIANFDELSEYANFSSITTQMEFDIYHLGTLLYGLFPFNFSKFCQAPLGYIFKRKPQFIDTKYISDLGKEIKFKGHTNDRIDYTTKTKTRILYQSLLVHPKFIDFDKNSMEDELKNPVQWILDANNGDSIGSEEVSTSCLSLNPDILVNLNDSVTLLPDSQPPLNTPEASKQVSRKSSLGSPLSLGGVSSALGLNSLQNIQRKMSVVPTNLVIDQKDSGGSVLFKDVKFNETKPDIDTSNIEFHPFEKSEEPISDLLSTHEKLFGPQSKLSSTDLARKPSILKSEVRIQKPISSPTTSVETTTAAIHKGSIGSSSGISTLNSNSNSNNNISNGNGSALDYYQRELLLMKNALEFSSYMKHLNKFYYIKLKLKMNKLLREANLHFQSIAHKNNMVQIQELNNNLQDLLEALEKLQIEFNDKKIEFEKERIDLTNQLKSLQETNERLKYSYEEVTDENKSIKIEINQLMESILPRKEIEIENLRIKLKEIEVSDKYQQPIEIIDNSINSQSDTSEVDKKLYTLKEEILQLQNKNSKIGQELNRAHEAYQTMQKNYEYKLASSKMDLNENLNVFTSHYDKKIQELSTTILKYEALLEDKNSKILQLSSSKPISIPISGSGSSSGLGYGRVMDNRIPMRVSRTSTGEFNEGLETEKGRSNSSLDSVSPPPSTPNPHILQSPMFGNYPHNHYGQPAVPIQQPIVMRANSSNLLGQTQPPASQQQQQLQSQLQQQSQQPIIRGRGGLQKRSKKIM